MKENRIAINDIQKKEEFKRIIPIEIDGVENYIYVKNPTLEQFDYLYEEIEKILSDESEKTNKEIFAYMFENLTNVDLGDYDFENFGEQRDNTPMIELVFALEDIYQDIERTIYLTYISIYEKEYTENILNRLTNMIDKKFTETEKENEEIEKETDTES